MAELKYIWCEIPEQTVTQEDREKTEQPCEPLHISKIVKHVLYQSQ